MSGVIQVGRYNKYTQKKYAYSDIKHESDGWVNAKKYLPLECDLCLLKTKDKKIITGWRGPHRWDGLKLRPYMQIVSWKREKD